MLELTSAGRWISQAWGGRLSRTPGGGDRASQMPGRNVKQRAGLAPPVHPPLLSDFCCLGPQIPGVLIQGIPPEFYSELLLRACGASTLSEEHHGSDMCLVVVKTWVNISPSRSACFFKLLQTLDANNPYHSLLRSRIFRSISIRAFVGSANIWLALQAMKRSGLTRIQPSSSISLTISQSKYTSSQS